MQTLRLHTCAGRGRSNGKARESSLVASLALETYGNKTSQLRWMTSTRDHVWKLFGIHIRSFWGQLNHELIWCWYELIDHKPQITTGPHLRTTTRSSWTSASSSRLSRYESWSKTKTEQIKIIKFKEFQGAKERRACFFRKVRWNSAFSHLMFSWAHPW